MDFRSLIRDKTRKYSESQFHKKIKKYKFAHQFVDFDNAHNIGFLINVNKTSPKEIVAISDYLTRLKEKGKKVIIIEVNLGRKAESMFNEMGDTIFVDSTHINWLSYPSKEIMFQINKRKIEILVNLDRSNELLSKYLTSFSNAKTRVGYFEEGTEVYYDFMMILPKDTSIRKVLKDMEYYLKMFEK